MSNATDTPQKQGQRRRRRSRGGKNRNQNQNQNQGQSNRPQGGGSKSGEGRPRRRRSSRSPKPVKLTFWQKLLKAIGLYKEPTRKPQPRKEQDSDSAPAPKSNTRNARSRDEAGSRKSDSTGKRGKRDNRRKGGDPSTVESGRVYVGNLSYDVTEEDLKELFKGVGNVRRVEIVYNRNTHRSKGYGFVEMMNKEDAIRSVEVLHDQPFMGRNMTVSGAKNKADYDEEDNEPTMEIKASDVALAPLPQKSESDAPAESVTESTPEAAQEEATEPVAEAPAESESAEDEHKQA